MKKRYKSRLVKSRKKNILFILVCMASITVILMTGCSITKPSLSETQINNEFPSEQMDSNEKSSENSTDNFNVQAETQKLKESEPDTTNNQEEILSEDGQELKSIAENFAAAYFSGDRDTIQSYLTSPYEWDIEVYEGLDTTGAGTISELILKGLTDIDKEETGITQVISLEFRDSNYESMFIYLTIEFVKQEDGWKIQFYGLEG